MKLNRHIFLRVFLVTTLAAILLPAVVSAQRFSMRPPVLPRAVPPPIGRSMAYVDAGVKWRNIDKIRFERQPHIVAGQGLTGQVVNDATIEFTEKLLMPAIEFGHQYGNFFGLLLGLSGFNLTVTDLAATGGEMSSGDIFTEMLTQRMDITTIEFKVAGRSWFPMFETGCIGVSYGGLFAVNPYRIVTRSVAYADGRNVVLLAPGTIIQDLENKLEKRCQELTKATHDIRALTRYHWWPDAA